MSSSGIGRRVAVVRTVVSKERTASIIRVTRFGELGTIAAVSKNVFLRSVLHLPVIPDVVPSSLILVTLMMEAIRSSGTSFLTGIT
jgi:hypothetical protein